MIQSQKAIVIHSIRYTHSKQVVRMFTAEHGLKAFLVNSGKSNKGGVANLLQPLSLVEFECSMKEQSQLQALRELRLAHPWQSIPFDAGKIAVVLFLNEILHKTIPDDYQNNQLFQFLWHSLVLLDDAVEYNNFHLWCLLEITRHYGFYPQAEDGARKYFDMQSGIFVNAQPPHTDCMNADESNWLYALLDKEWPEVQHLAMTGVLRKNVLTQLVHYIRLHLETLRQIHSLQVLHDIFQ
ncbi:MAG: DNA repair protein RecO [Flavobacteriales bacterium]